MTESAPPDPPAPKPPPKPPNNWVGLGLLAAWLVLGGVICAGPSGWTGPAVFAFVMLGWILAVMAHEFSHAVTAWLGGELVYRLRVAVDDDAGLDATNSLAREGVATVKRPGGTARVR